MQNFDLFLPTHLVFGRGRLAELAATVKTAGRKVLLTYGAGSIKQNGLYEAVKAQLAGFEVFELSGIAPNPRIDSVRKGVEICRTEGIDFLVAVGGGSVIDATKAIAAGACYKGDAWDLIVDHPKIGAALPFYAVLTLSATGSEYDNSGVITNPATQEKMFLAAPNLFPRVSFCDPTYTFTVSSAQTAAGACDILSHTFEQYFVAEGNEITDSLCEAVIRTVVRNTPVAVREPENYEARAELMMASSFGCCGILSIGRSASPWPCHGIEHEISAFHDITHGVGLAIITPHWMRYSLNKKTAPRFAQYGERVWGLTRTDDMACALRAIEKTENFFHSIGIPAKLSDVGVTDEYFEAMADHVSKVWYPLDSAFAPIDRAGVLSILQASL